MKINTMTFKLNIFQAYTPTTEKDDESVKQFYRGLKTALAKKEEITMRMDFNTRSVRGETLIHSCK